MLLGLPMITGEIHQQGASNGLTGLTFISYLTAGLLELYAATFNDSYLQFAEQLQSRYRCHRLPRPSADRFLEYLNKYFLASGSGESGSAGYYMTSSEMSREVVGPLFRLKTGTDAATPSTNGVIAQNLLRLSSLLEDESSKSLAQQTCNTFAVEILQHPFLFVNLLDVVVGLEVGVKTVTGVVGRSDEDAEATAGGSAVPIRAKVISRMREEAGPAASTSAAVLSLVEVVGPEESKTAWLRKRNHLLKDILPGKNMLLVCEAGSCKTADID
jgi:uncharacterized protein YyaL (SSP411 family)